MIPKNPTKGAGDFTTQEQVAGYKWLSLLDPSMAARPASDPDLFVAFIDACEDVVCLDIADALAPQHRSN